MISIEIDNDFGKQFKFEILQDTIPSFELWNFASGQPPLRQVPKGLFYLEHIRNNYQKLSLPPQTRRAFH